MIGFINPKTGVRWLLIGSHTSVVRAGQSAMRKPGCVGCFTVAHGNIDESGRV